MKKIILLTLSIMLVFNFSLTAQKKGKKEKNKTEKTKKDNTTEEESETIYENKDSEDYKTKDREDVSKIVMPNYSEDQPFHSTDKKKAQQEAFQDRKYYYPSKPNHAWQVGVFTGVSTLLGDVTPNLLYGNKPMFPGHNFGVHVTKAWSYIFATRLKASAFEMYTNDAVASTLTREQVIGIDRFNDRKMVASGYREGQEFFHNSRSQGYDLNFDFVFSFGNLKFHRERTNIIFKVFPSLGYMMYKTYNDHLDADGNAYDYESIVNLNDLGTTSRGDVIKSLSALRDGKYETIAEKHTVGDEALVLGFTPRFVFGIGAGFTFRIVDWLYFDFETRQMLTQDDLIDGMQWEEPLRASIEPISRGLTANFDSYNQTTIGVTFNLIGKKTTEPLTMLNPMHYSYQKIAEGDPQKAIDDLMRDTDGDGVPNRLDQEDDTPEGAPVGPRGIALDSDKDGIIDLNDNEPFSAPGLAVDDQGVADANDENFAERVRTIVSDMDNNVTVNNNTGETNSARSSSNSSCGALSIELPSVHFDSDKYNIKPEFYAHIHEVAERMMTCPNAKVLAIGAADKNSNSKYNEQLSYNRVDNVIDYITETYGIDRERFIVKYDGEATSNGNSYSEQYQDRKVSFKLVEEETGESNPSAPHPGMKAGSIK